MRVEWSVDVHRAQWWTDRLHPPGQDVGSVIPDGFEAYARVFHPTRDDGTPLSWSQLAAMNGRVAHAEMQFDAIASPAGPGERRAQVDHPAQGSLPDRQLTALVRLLAEHTTTPDRCWFAIWDGFAQLHGGRAVATTMWFREADDVAFVRPGSRTEPVLLRHVSDGPRARAPSREYVIASGPLADVEEFSAMLGGQTPNVWWPDDRAWIVASEIDFTWTYVAGDRDVVDAVIAEPALEALETEPSHHITFDSDQINT